MNSRGYTVTSIAIAFMAVTLLSVPGFGGNAYAAGAGMSLSADADYMSGQINVSGDTDRTYDPVIIKVTNSNGVHAVGQIAHFDLKKKIKKKNFILGVNQYIGNNPVTILNIIKTDNNFHSRFDAKKRTYQYVIINRQSPLALEKNKAWHIRKKLDLKSMKKGARLLLGTHDFSTFRASSCGAKSPIKTLRRVSIKKKKDKLIFKFISK